MDVLIETPTGYLIVSSTENPVLRASYDFPSVDAASNSLYILQNGEIPSDLSKFLIKTYELESKAVNDGNLEENGDGEEFETGQNVKFVGNSVELKSSGYAPDTYLNVNLSDSHTNHNSGDSNNNPVNNVDSFNNNTKITANSFNNMHKTADSFNNSTDITANSFNNMHKTADSFNNSTEITANSFNNMDQTAVSSYTKQSNIDHTQNITSFKQKSSNTEYRLPEKHRGITLICGDKRLSLAITTELNIPAIEDFSKYREAKSNLKLSLDPKVGLAVAHRLAGMRVSAPHSVDVVINQLVDILSSLDEELNLKTMRVKEWYGTHFPELEGFFSDNTKFLKGACIIQVRESFVRIMDLHSIESVPYDVDYTYEDCYKVIPSKNHNDILYSEGVDKNLQNSEGVDNNLQNSEGDDQDLKNFKGINNNHEDYEEINNDLKNHEEINNNLKNSKEINNDLKNHEEINNNLKNDEEINNNLKNSHKNDPISSDNSQKTSQNLSISEKEHQNTSDTNVDTLNESGNAHAAEDINSPNTPRKTRRICPFFEETMNQHTVSLKAFTNTVIALRKELSLTDTQIMHLKTLASMSIGLPITHSDYRNIQSCIHSIFTLTSHKSNLTSLLQQRMSSLAPNATALVGFSVASKILSKLGSLSSCARAPASTLQIVGAEKAFFEAVRNKSNTPKFGHIFNAKIVQQACVDRKGAVARSLSTKLALCFRIDCYSNNSDCSFGVRTRENLTKRLDGVGLRKSKKETKLGKMVFEKKLVYDSSKDSSKRRKLTSNQ